MARLPPPPTIGRSPSKADGPEAEPAADRAARDAENARARAELPDAVVELPDAWLTEALASPPPAPRAAATVDQAVREAALAPVATLAKPASNTLLFVPPPPPRGAWATSDAAVPEPQLLVGTAEVDLIEDAAEAAPLGLTSPTAAVSEDAPTIARTDAPELDEARALAAAALASEARPLCEPSAEPSTEPRTETGAEPRTEPGAEPGAVAAPPSTSTQPSPPVRGAAETAAATNGGVSLSRRGMWIGAVLGAVALVAIVIRCAGAPAPTTAPQAVAASTGPRGSSPEAEADNPAPTPGAASKVAEADGAAGNDRAAASAAATSAAARGEPGDPAGAVPSAPADDRAPTQQATAEDAAAGATVGDDSADAASADAATADPPEVATPAGASRPKPKPRADTITPSKPTATTAATPEENLALARAAWKTGNAKDTYKYANKSRYQQPTAEATELATLAACKMKLDDAAKSTFKQLEGERKKRARTACRDFGVRVGL